MKKTLLQLLMPVVVAVLTYIITKFVLDPLSRWPRSLSWLLAIAAFLVAVVVLASLSKQDMQALWEEARRRVQGLRRRVQSTFATDSHVFAKFFDFEEERVRVVYTCRSRIDKAQCPIHEQGEGPHLQHVINQHVPVDEFLTQQLMVQWYKEHIQREEHEGLRDRFTCSYPLDKFGDMLANGKPLSRVDLPDFMFDNLIIIGENGCANLVLDRLFPILNFYPIFNEVEGVFRTLSRRRIHIDLIFAARNGNSISQTEKLLLRTSFDRNNSNAVAMLCYAPNPFNLQKRVLILFGAHRVGQYLLEEWLHRHESNHILRRLLKSQDISVPAFGQVVLHGSFIEKSSPEGCQFSDIAVTKNVARRQIPFFPFATKMNRVTREGYGIDPGAAAPGPMVDISLVIDLPRHDARIAADIDGLFQKELPFLQGHYWESQGRNAGLHVTLYEFATHKSHETLAEGAESFGRLEQVLAEQLSGARSPRLTLAGCEVFSSAIVIYADLPVDFLELMLEKCGPILPNNGYLNRRRMPFPLHCTVLRLSRSLNRKEQEQLQHVADATRKHLFGEFYVQTLSLQLAQKQPYQEVERRFDLELAPRDGAQSNPSVLLTM